MYDHGVMMHVKFCDDAFSFTRVIASLISKLKKIVGKINFSAQFIKIISHFKKICYKIKVLQ